MTDHFLVMATRNGLVKKTPLSAYGRPRNGGIIAVKLREDDEIIDVLVTKTGDELVLSTENGMAIRFRESDARPMGRNTSGVKGISLGAGDKVVGMVVVDPDATLLTACEKGYGKRTKFGINSNDDSQGNGGDETGDGDGEVAEDSDSVSSGSRYRTQNRGGKGLRDIKTTTRNGKVIGIKSVRDDDQLLLMTSRGKIQRIKCADVSTIGRNTQGVRIMGLDDEDSLAVIALVPRDELGDDMDDEIVEIESVTPVSTDTPPADGSQVEPDAGTSTDTDTKELGESE